MPNLHSLGASVALLAGSSLASLAAPPVLPNQPTGSLVVQADAICGPGYHIGAGGRRCWPNGYAPAVEVPAGYVVPGPPVVPMPPILTCPIGYHLGPALRRCRPN